MLHEQVHRSLVYQVTGNTRASKPFLEWAMSNSWLAIRKKLCRVSKFTLNSPWTLNKTKHFIPLLWGASGSQDEDTDREITEGLWGPNGACRKEHWWAGRQGLCTQAYHPWVCGRGYIWASVSLPAGKITPNLSIIIITWRAFEIWILVLWVWGGVQKSVLFKNSLL